LRSRGIPLLFVQDVSGFMVVLRPSTRDHRAGARFVEAMATARVPKIVSREPRVGRRLLRHGGQGFDPDFIFTWPTGAWA
jgi:acetyl-CoA carboxylase carboxyltransferase component